MPRNLSVRRRGPTGQSGDRFGESALARAGPAGRLLRVGEQTPLRGSRRPAAKPLRLALLAAVLASAVVLTGCSEQSRHEWQNLAMPDPASVEGEHIFT